jgi:hypothetical protein
MIDVYKENSEDGSFEEMPTDGMLVDLADVVTMSVRQTSD